MKRESGDHAQRPSRRVRARAVGVIVVVGLLVAFVFDNFQHVSVRFGVGTAHPQLVWVMAGCVAVGIVVGLVARLPRRNRGKEKLPPA